MDDSNSSSSNTSSSLLDLDSDDDLDIEAVLIDRIRPKNEGYFEQTIPLYSEKEFHEHFRISRQISQEIANRFQGSDHFKHQSGGFGKLSALQHVLIFLWFAGHQTASFRDVADRFNISISSLYNVIRRITMFLSGLSEEIIRWPENQERVEILEYFQNNGFPGVIGTIDGSHIKIDKPDDDADSYLNRKKYYSIQVNIKICLFFLLLFSYFFQIQVVCDHNLLLRDIFIGYPGSVHDSRVFRNSPLSNDLVNKCRDNYLLGDSGYPCLRHLLTPYPDHGHLTAIQQRFNLKLSKNRYLVEHCLGVLKQKFRQLYHVKLRSVNDIVHFIRACCVLHNLAIKDEFEGNWLNNVVQVVPLQGMNEEPVEGNREGQEYRNFIARYVLDD